MSPRAKLSAFVITYNRETIIGTCLRALAFADEVIVIDKGSTDSTLTIAASLADRIIRVPWSPTVEETRAFAVTQCTHDWVLFLDDDECLSPEAVHFIDAELRAPRADIYRFPQRHYIIGIHDDRAYYWPEEQIRLFHRPAIAFTPTVHGGIHLLSERLVSAPADRGVCMHHLSHRDVAQWIEKANRYTSQPDRKRTLQEGSGIGRFSHERIDHWLARTKSCEPDAYPAMVAVLRAVYDLIDRLKGWEEEAGIDGEALFRAACARLDAAYATDLAGFARPRAGVIATIPADDAAAVGPASPLTGMETAIASRAISALRDSVQVHREAMDAARADRDAAMLRETEERERADEMRRWAESQQARVAEVERTLGEFSRHHDATLAAHAATARDRAVAHDAELSILRAALTEADYRRWALEASTSWRITAPLRTVMRLLGVR